MDSPLQDFSSLQQQPASNAAYRRLDDASGTKAPGSDKVSVFALFRFATALDKLLVAMAMLLAVGAGSALPLMNIIFAALVGNNAALTSVGDQVNKSVIYMLYVALGYGVTAGGFSMCQNLAATRIATRVRVQYFAALVRQDMALFDGAMPGQLAGALIEDAEDFQNGVSNKMAEVFQGVAALIVGFTIAFWYGWKLALVVIGLAPLLAAAGFVMSKYSDAGVLGKKAYEAANGVVAETLSSMRTVSSINGQASAAQRYERNLVDAEKAAIRAHWFSGFANSGLYSVMFLCYGVGMWYGAKLIADTTQAALNSYPLPEDFFNDVSNTSVWAKQRDLALDSCFYSDDASRRYTGDALKACACSLDYGELPNPDCGCGHGGYAGGSASGLPQPGAPCFSGADVILVFFSIIVGAAFLGQAGPAMQLVFKAQSAAKKLYAMAERAPAIADPERGAGGAGGISLDGARGALRFSGVHFAYNATPDEVGRAVFDGLELAVGAGETLAIVGESGSGKSTIGRLVSRFYDPQRGFITLDGVDLRDLNLRELRALVGTVSQEPLLFDLSIYDNIALGLASSGRTPTRPEVLAAAKAANAHEFIMGFPKGYATRVGARGAKLSGGQKQRVAIARAVLRNPTVLILDEATSALDTESERVVQKALDELIHGGKRTTIVIAHRLTTVRNADRIVVLGTADRAQGLAGGGARGGARIVEQGTHDALMAKPGGKYRSLVGIERSDGGGARRSARRSSSTNGARHPDVSERRGGGGELPGEARGGGGGAAAAAAEEAPKLNEGSDDSGAVWAGYSVKSGRLWSYSKPEFGVIVLGTLCAMVYGAGMPACAFIFADLLAVFYSFDTDHIEEKSIYYAAGFWIIAGAMFVCGGVALGLFGIVGERLTTRLRTHCFRALLRQEIAFFDDPANAVGALASRLSSDASLIRYVTGQALGSQLQLLSTAGLGLTIAMVASWKYGLVLLGGVPIIAVGEAVALASFTEGGRTTSEQRQRSSAHAEEVVQMIREVQSFGLEEKVVEIYAEMLEAPMRTDSLGAIKGGLLMGLSQGLSLCFYALAFWWGGWLIDRGELSFQDMMRALWALAFMAAGMAQVASFAGDSGKANAAKERLFHTIDATPAIDSKPFDERGAARALPRAVGVDEAVGTILPPERFRGASRV